MTIDNHLLAQELAAEPDRQWLRFFKPVNRSDDKDVRDAVRNIENRRREIHHQLRNK